VALPIENKFAVGNLFNYDIKQEESNCWVIKVLVVYHQYCWLPSFDLSF